MANTEGSQWYFWSVFLFCNVLSGISFSLQIFSLYAKVSNFVFMCFLHVWMCVCQCLPVFLVGFFLWLFLFACLSVYFALFRFVYIYFILLSLLLLLLFLIDACLFFNEREKKRVWIWVNGEAGGIWEELREGNHIQNISHERKSIFTFIQKKKKIVHVCKQRSGRYLM